MMRRTIRRSLLTILAVSTLTAGCGNPCEEIAETACATAGAESEECGRLEQLAAHASSEDRRACAVALNLVESLEKVQ